MKSLLQITIAAMILIGASSANAQSFEGKIEFTKTIGPVTANYTYFVKNNLIRVEEVGENGDIQGIMIVDTKENTVTALSPERQMFIDVPNNRAPKAVDVKVDKTSNTKTINGYACKEWIVNCTEDGRSVSYWVADDHFDFFTPMLNTLNRKDKLAVYFNLIPDAAGVFPMEGVESKIQGAEISRLQVNKITKGPQNDLLFKIPQDYARFEKE
jgi:hypothetical protein